MLLQSAQMVKLEMEALCMYQIHTLGAHENREKQMHLKLINAWRPQMQKLRSEKSQAQLFPF